MSYDDGECVSCNRLSEEMAKLRNERDELAAQVEVMRSAISEAMGWNWLSDTESIPEPVVKQLADALALPNTAADILRQRDARTLREAAKKFSDGMEPHSAGTWVGRCLEQMADELECKNG